MKKINVIIPAAGAATRLKPLTKNMSKAMVDVNGKPIISYIIDSIKDFANEIVIVDGQFNDIRAYCKKMYSHLNIKFVKQLFLNGPLNAIQMGYEVLDNKSNILVWLGDTIINDFQDRFNTSFALYSTVNQNDLDKYCIVAANNNLMDKPKIQDGTIKGALIGFYYFDEYDSIILNDAFNNITTETDISYLLSYDGIEMEYIKTDAWLDCGTLENLYETKSKLINRKARKFNEIHIDNHYNTIAKFVNKIGDPKERQQHLDTLDNERSWYDTIKNDRNINCFLPKIIYNNADSLTMELLSGTLLSDIFMYNDIGTINIEFIINKILSIIHTDFMKCNNENYQIFDKRMKEYLLYNMFVNKNLTRVFKYQHKYNWINQNDIDFVTHNILVIYHELLKTDINETWAKVILGDLHLGNIIFNPENGSIKFIDPRGEFGGEQTTQGDIRYDIGKLYHDVYCNYGYIIADLYDIDDNNNVTINIPTNNIDMCIILDKCINKYGYDVTLMKKLGSLFLLTCLPFHNDNEKRQKALWYHGLSILKELTNV